MHGTSVLSSLQEEKEREEEDVTPVASQGTRRGLSKIYTSSCSAKVSTVPFGKEKVGAAATCAPHQFVTWCSLGKSSSATHKYLAHKQLNISVQHASTVLAAFWI
jgi:hypothetical protein